MNPHSHNRLKQAQAAAPTPWVEASADDVLEACAVLYPPDEVTIRLTHACQKVLQGRVPPRRGQPPARPMNISRKDLDHLLTRLAQPVPEPEPTPEPEQQALPEPAPREQEPPERARTDEEGKRG